MAYMTPEERISGLVNRGYEGLRGRFETLRGQTPTAPAPAAAPPPAPAAPSQLAKVPGDVSKIMPRQALAVNHGDIPTRNFIRSEETGNTVSLNSDNSIRWSDSAGRTISRPEGGMRGGTQQPMASNGMQRVGNMDVSFDDSVSPGARAAFLRNPVRPTAQIDRYDAAQAADAERREQPREMPQSLGVRFLSNRKRFAGLNERADMRNKQNLDMMQLEEQGRRTDIDAARTAASVDLDRAQTAVVQGELDRAAEIDNLAAQYQETEDVGLRGRIKERIDLLSGRKADTAGSYSVIEVPTGEVDQLGTPITKKVMANPVTGEIFDPATKMGGPAAEPLPPLEKRVVGKRYIGAGGRVAVWDGKGLIEEK